MVFFVISYVKNYQRGNIHLPWLFSWFSHDIPIHSPWCHICSYYMSNQITGFSLSSNVGECLLKLHWVCFLPILRSRGLRWKAAEYCHAVDGQIQTPGWWCISSRPPEFQCYCLMSPCQSSGDWFISSIRGHVLEVQIILKLGDEVGNVNEGLNNSSNWRYTILKDIYIYTYI